MPILNILVVIVIAAWLVVCATYDVRSRQVPNWLTLPPLVLAAIGLVVTDRWLLAVLVAGLVLVSELPSKYGRRRVLLGGILTFLLAVFLPNPETIFQALVLYGIWAIWELRLTGAADAKLMMALVGLFSGAIIFAIFMAGGLQGLWWKWRRRTEAHTMPYTIAIAAGALFWLATNRW
jgi:Flp pilus assembly protein protease CpaA